MFRICALAVLALVSVARGQCHGDCRFTFCPSGTSFSAPKENVAFTGAICANFVSAPIGLVQQTGEAMIFDKTLTPISQWDPSVPGKRLKQNFSPSFFKIFTRFTTVGGEVRSLGNSGVGRENFQANQKDFINGQCIVLPLKAWQELNADGSVKDNVVSNNPLDCVVLQVHS